MTYRAFSIQTTMLVLGAGIALLVLSVGPLVEPKVASILNWVSIVGGVGLILIGLVALGVALGRNEKPNCPHCGKPVEVNVATWSGKLQVDKRGAA